MSFLTGITCCSSLAMTYCLLLVDSHCSFFSASQVAPKIDNHCSISSLAQLDDDFASTSAVYKSD